MLSMRQFAVITCLIAFGLSACSKQSELEEARRRIAQLESELASAKVKGLATGGPLPIAAPQVSKTAVSEQQAEHVGQQWAYIEREDKMTGGTTYQATVPSTNTVNFGFPYAGPQNGRLTLRIDPKYGRDIIFTIERGQLLCHSYEDCEVLVRFDEGKPERFSAVGAADNSSNTLFIRNYDKFIGKLQKSKLVRLSVNIYQNGAPVFEFDVSGFNAAKYAGKKG